MSADDTREALHGIVRRYNLPASAVTRLVNELTAHVAAVVAEKDEAYAEAIEAMQHATRLHVAARVEIERLTTLAEARKRVADEACRIGDEALSALAAVTALADEVDEYAREQQRTSRVYTTELRRRLAPVSGAVAKRHLITTPHDGHGDNETCPTCPHTPVAKHEQEVRADERGDATGARCKSLGCRNSNDGSTSEWWTDYGCCSRACAVDYYGSEAIS